MYTKTLNVIISDILPLSYPENFTKNLFTYLLKTSRILVTNNEELAPDSISYLVSNNTIIPLYSTGIVMYKMYY
jgi:hypothetical protein